MVKEWNMRIIVLVLSLLMAGCGIDAGQVYQKAIARSKMAPKKLVVDGIEYRVSVHVASEWHLHIRNGGKTGHCSVSETRYNNTKIGDWVVC